MEEAPENGKELSHSSHANGMNEIGTSAHHNCLSVSVKLIPVYVYTVYFSDC
jgi:hypothetical protein